MKIDKLFNVLVLGGALVAGVSSANPSAPVTDALETPVQVAGDAELQGVLCNDDTYCEVSACGHKHAKAGFECCWGTSCDDK